MMASSTTLAAFLLARWCIGEDAAFMYAPKQLAYRTSHRSRLMMSTLDEDRQVRFEVSTVRAPWDKPSVSDATTTSATSTTSSSTALQSSPTRAELSSSSSPSAAGDISVVDGDVRGAMGEGDEGGVTLLQKIWRNCDAVTKRCLGNALDEPNYRNGVIASIGLTLGFSSQHPALHSVYSTIAHHPPVPLLNAGSATCAALAMVVGGEFLQSLAPCKVEASGADKVESPERRDKARRAGMELGLWKTIAACVNLAGLSSTSASHGAFLIQLTTLIVPLVQGIMGIPIARQIWTGIGLAMAGLYLFTNDATSASEASVTGDILCVLSAVFYSAYDLRVFQFGQQFGDTPAELIQNKVLTQAALSIGIVAAWAGYERFQTGADDVTTFLTSVTGPELLLIIPVMLWCGVMVNAAASVIQVGAVQAIGASRSQIIYATGPLWSAIMSMIVLGERAGPKAVVGGTLFLAAMLVAATAPPPESVCNEDDVCEV